MRGSGNRTGAIVLTALLLIAVAAVGSQRSFAAHSGAGSCGRFNLAPRQATLHQMRSSILCLINRARSRKGIRPLDFNPHLRESATIHSRQMVRDGYFSHVGPSGSVVSARISRAGYGGWTLAGENIGGGWARRHGSARAVFESWMHSSGHRANILDPRFRDFGAGVWPGFPLGGGRRSATYTVDFARR